MRPNDKNAALPVSERPLRVLIISGSQRRQYNCSGVDSKSRTLMFRMADQMPDEWEVDLEDIGNVIFREKIQSCNACVSTSMALCCWPCNCYEKNSRLEPDLMHNLDLYSRLDMADAWVFIAPVNWYGVTSNLKLMFDRLVCMNGGNPREDLIDHKDVKKAIKLEHSEFWKGLSLNHLEGRTAAFFCYGDNGGDELDESGRPKILKHPEYLNPGEEPFEDMRQTFAPLVWQCRYSGIEVPDNLWKYIEFGVGKKYSDNQAEDMSDEQYIAFDQWRKAFVDFVMIKGKIPANKYRAYGYKPHSHFIADLKYGWNFFRKMIGISKRNSSPHIQKKKNLNRDTTMNPYRGEGQKLRK